MKRQDEEKERGVRKKERYDVKREKIMTKNREE
jgi:hypothetical protein